MQARQGKRAFLQGAYQSVRDQENAELNEVLRSRFSVFNLRANAVNITRKHRRFTNVLCAKNVHR